MKKDEKTVVSFCSLFHSFAFFFPLISLKKSQSEQKDLFLTFCSKKLRGKRKQKDGKVSKSMQSEQKLTSLSFHPFSSFFV